MRIQRWVDLILLRRNPSGLKARADEFAAVGDDGGAATWRRITVGELANTTPPGPVHGPAIVPHNYLYDGA